MGETKLYISIDYEQEEVDDREVKGVEIQEEQETDD